jgi:hypothetical protein
MGIIKRALCFGTILLVLAGCHHVNLSAQKMNMLNVGMTKNQVYEAIGAPESTSAEEADEYLYYDRYCVKLLDGKVVAFGSTGEVKSKKKKHARDADE